MRSETRSRRLALPRGARALVGVRNDERGASAVEYGLLVFAIAAIIVVVVVALGKYTRGTYVNTCSALSGQITPSGPASCS